MKQGILSTIILIFGLTAGAYQSPFEHSKHGKASQEGTQVSDRASDIARCFNGNIRTGMDYVQVLKDCMERASLDGKDTQLPEEQEVAEAAF